MTKATASLTMSEAVAFVETSAGRSRFEAKYESFRPQRRAA